MWHLFKILGPVGQDYEEMIIVVQENSSIQSLERCY